MSGIDSELIRGHIDTIILKTLDGSSKYGYEICHDVETVSNGEYELKQPTLYSCLKRLEDKGLISSYWEDSDIGGRRHYYKLTQEGKKVYNENTKNWILSRDIIDSLILDNTTPSYSAEELVEIDADLIRGNIDTIILKTLETGAKYGYEICRDVEEKSNKTYELKQPTLYSCLKRLEDKELISSYWEDSDIGGRRHYYKLTQKGVEALQENKLAWEESKELINRLIFNSATYTQHVSPTTSTTTQTMANENVNVIDFATTEVNEQQPETVTEETTQQVLEEETNNGSFENTETDNEVVEETVEEESTYQTTSQMEDASTVDDAWFADETTETTNIDAEEETVEADETSSTEPSQINESQENEETSATEETEETTTPSFFAQSEDDTDCQVDIPQTSSIIRERTLENTSNATEEETNNMGIEEDEETENNETSFDDFLAQNESNYAAQVSQQKPATQQEETTQDDLFDTLHFSSITDEIEPLQQEQTQSMASQSNEPTIILPDIIEETSDTDFDIHQYISQNKSYLNATTEEQNITFAPKPTVSATEPDENTTYTFYKQEEQQENAIKEPVASVDEDDTEDYEDDHKYDDEIFLDYKPNKEKETQEQPNSTEESVTEEKPLYTATYTEKEYRDALDKLSAYTKNNELNDSHEDLQTTEKTSLEALQKKLEQKGITLSIYQRGVSVPESTKNYVATNKIKMVRSLITLCFMSFLLALTYISLNNYGYVNQDLYATNTYFIVAFALICIPPIFASIRYAIHPTKKHIARFAPRISLLFALLFTVQILVIIYSVNLQLGFTSFTQTNYNHLNWIVPCVLTLYLFVDCIVYIILYNSKKFHK